MGLFCLTGEGLVPVLFFALLAWNTNEGIFGVGLLTGQQYLSLALSDQERTSIYIASATFVNGAGMFVGSMVGGFMLDWLASRTHPDLPQCPLWNLLHLLWPGLPGGGPLHHRATRAPPQGSLNRTGTAHVQSLSHQDPTLN